LIGEVLRDNTVVFTTNFNQMIETIVNLIDELDVGNVKKATYSHYLTPFMKSAGQLHF